MTEFTQPNPNAETKPQGETPSITQEQFGNMITSGAKHELFYIITGEDKIYDPNDPAVEQRALEIAEKAIAEGVYTDTNGVQHKLSPSGLDNRTALELFNARMKRLIKDSSK